MIESFKEIMAFTGNETYIVANHAQRKLSVLWSRRRKKTSKMHTRHAAGYFCAVMAE